MVITVHKENTEKPRAENKNFLYLRQRNKHFSVVDTALPTTCVFGVLDVRCLQNGLFTDCDSQGFASGVGCGAVSGSFPRKSTWDPEDEPPHKDGGTSREPGSVRIPWRSGTSGQDAHLPASPGEKMLYVALLTHSQPNPVTCYTCCQTHRNSRLNPSHFCLPLLFLT